MSPATAYEDTRRRHLQDAMDLVPGYLARLRWSRAEIEPEQTRALRELLRHAVTHSRWHRERLAGVDIEGIALADVPALPVMTKSDLMANWDAIVTDRRCTLEAAERHLATLTGDAYFLDDYHVIASSGSSGTRGVFAYDWHGWARSWLGISRGLFAILMGRPHVPSGPAASVAANVATHATYALASTFSTPARPTVPAPVTRPVAEIVATLNRSQPSLLQCSASMLPVLCEAVRSGRLRIAPALVFSSSEPLLAEARAMAESAWGVPVANLWACSESPGGSFPCASDPGVHIGEDINIVEPVASDGTPVIAGQRSAHILVTNLYNRLVPLIRYEISDEFTVAPDPCPCGSAYTKVADVEGRADDVFVYPDGLSVHPLNFRSILGRQPARMHGARGSGTRNRGARGGPFLPVANGEMASDPRLPTENAPPGFGCWPFQRANTWSLDEGPAGPNCEIQSRWYAAGMPACHVHGVAQPLDGGRHARIVEAVRDEE